MNKVRYAVIGINGIGKTHIRAVQQNKRAELTALVDVDSVSVQEQAQKLGVRGFTDHREMLDAGIADAVSIATPHHLHTPIALTCLDAGLHIFVEKPIATKISDAIAIVEKAKAKGVKFSAGYQYRTFQYAQVMKHLIQNGIIGNIQRVLWSWASLRRHAYFEHYPWKGKWETSGGALLSFWVGHDLDTVRWLLGKPVQVSAFLGNQLHNIEAEDLLSANILFQNGTLATFQATLNQPRAYSVRQIAGDRGMIIIQNCKSLTYDLGDKLLLGTYQEPLQSLMTTSKNLLEEAEIQWHTIELKDRSTESRKSAPPSPRGRLRDIIHRLLNQNAKPKPAPLPHGLQDLVRQLSLPSARAHGLFPLLDSFIDSILDGTEPMVTGDEVLQTQELMNAITLSAIQKKTVDLPIDPDEYDRVFDDLVTGKIQIPRFHQSV